MELSVVQLLMKNSQIRQFKYFKVLVQEFHVKVDLGFVNAIVDLLQQSEQTDDEEVQVTLYNSARLKANIKFRLNFLFP